MHFRHLTKYQKISLTAALLVLLVASVSGMTIRHAKGTDYSYEVRTTVERFGTALRSVSLASPSVAGEIDDAYRSFVTEELRAAWKADPMQALGRLTSSPWPERIEVGTVEKNADGTYTALGTVVEVVSDTGKSAAIYPVALTLVERNGEWLIQDATKGSYTAIPERRTVTGTYECLPGGMHMPETDTCALGVRAGDGRYYALDLTVLEPSDVMTRLVTGDGVRIEGTFVPVEHLSMNDYWLNYSIEAVVRVTSLSEL